MKYFNTSNKLPIPGTMQFSMSEKEHKLSGYGSGKSEAFQELPVRYPNVCKIKNITESPDLSQMLSR